MFNIVPSSIKAPAYYALNFTYYGMLQYSKVQPIVLIMLRSIFCYALLTNK